MGKSDIYNLDKHKEALYPNESGHAPRAEYSIEIFCHGFEKKTSNPKPKIHAYANNCASNTFPNHDRKIPKVAKGMRFPHMRV